MAAVDALLGDGLASEKWIDKLKSRGVSILLSNFAAVQIMPSAFLPALRPHLRRLVNNGTPKEVGSMARSYADLSVHEPRFWRRLVKAWMEGEGNPYAPGKKFGNALQVRRERGKRGAREPPRPAHERVKRGVSGERAGTSPESFRGRRTSA